MQYIKEAYKKAGACKTNLFFRKCSDAARDSGFKLKEDRLSLDIRKKFSTVRVEMEYVVQRTCRCPQHWKCTKPDE